jgi:beta-glucosidase
VTTPLTFPQGFLWGTATAAHQIEGNNTNSDWWRFEHEAGRVKEPSGDACDSFHLYERDLDIVASLGLNSYRFSIEWARIEPAEGEFSRASLNHYRRVLEACIARGLVPVVTLHHFTLPQWVADAGGFEAPKIVQWLGRYAQQVGQALGDLIGVGCTINEPNIVAVMGYRYGVFPPAVSDPARYVAVHETMRASHNAMVDGLKSGPGNYPVGLTLSMSEYVALEGAEDRMHKIRLEMEDKYLEGVRGNDFIGVQCYSKSIIAPSGMPDNYDGDVTDMGYPYWPQCVEHTIRRAADVTGIPVIMTENGIATSDDTRRIAYLDAALRGLHNCLRDGVDVRGYYQWSLLDNFEWVLGYSMRFGIVDVDRETFERTPKPSAHWFGSIAKNNALN